jgi:hypothetical protein
MAIAFGSAGAVATGTTSASVAYPSSIAAGDLLILTANAKYSAYTSAPPTGFTLLSERIGGSGGTGVDVGNVRTSVWYRIADGSETGSVSITKANETGTVIMGRMFRYTRSSGYGWSLLATDGNSNTGAASWSAAGANNIHIGSGDVVVAVSGANTDAATYSAQSLAATGATLSLTAERTDSGSQNGHDLFLFVTEHACSSGTSSAAPTYTATASTGTPDGPTIFVRIKEALGIAAEQGSHTLTGQAAGLGRTITMAAAVGLFALTGYTATFDTDDADASAWFQTAWVEGSWAFGSWYTGEKLINAEPGDHELSGQAAGLYKGYKVSAEQGSVELGGQDATLRTGYSIPAEQGSHTFSQGTTAFPRTYQIAAAQGSHTLTPQDVVHYTGSAVGRAWAVDAWYAGAWEGTVWADDEDAPTTYILGASTGYYSAPEGSRAWFDTAWVPGAWQTASWADGAINTGLHKGYTLTAATGYYVYTGDDPTYRDILFHADAGSHALTGQDATFSIGKFVAADVGSYALTGQDVTLTRGLRMTAQFGGFSTQGNDVEFEVNVGEFLQQVPYTLTGYDATFSVVRGITAEAGAYALTGQDVRLGSALEFLCDTGTYALTGQDASFRRDYTLTAECGSYTLGGQLVAPVAAAAAQTAAGGSRKKPERRYMTVIVGDDEYEVESQDQALQVIEAYKARAELRAQEEVEKAQAKPVSKRVARVVKHKLKAPEIQVKGDDVAAVRAEAEKAIQTITQTYADALKTITEVKKTDDDEADAIAILLG